MASLMDLGVQPGGEYEAKPAGLFPARCIQVIFLGEQPSKDFNTGETRHVNQVMLAWETPFETKEFRQGEGEKPYVYSRTYNVTMNERATLRKHLEGMTGPLKDFDAWNYDLADLIGKTCTLNVVHKTSAVNNKQYATIENVLQPQKGIKYPGMFNTPVYFDFLTGSRSVWQSLPDWLTKKISEAKDFDRWAPVEDVQTAKVNANAPLPDPQDVVDEMGMEAIVTPF